MTDTDNMQKELMDSPDLDRFLESHKDDFSRGSAADHLKRLFYSKKISKASLAKKACISEVYLHQVFAGKRNPSRNRLICLCFGLGASLDETQEFLKHCGCAQLYPKIKRDSIIVHGLVHELDLNKVNDKLFAENEESLY